MIYMYMYMLTMRKGGREEERERERDRQREGERERERETERERERERENACIQLSVIKNKFTSTKSTSQVYIAGSLYELCHQRVPYGWGETIQYNINVKTTSKPLY